MSGGISTKGEEPKKESMTSDGRKIRKKEERGVEGKEPRRRTHPIVIKHAPADLV